jgi:hypothetical protein
VPISFHREVIDQIWRQFFCVIPTFLRASTSNNYEEPFPLHKTFSIELKNPAVFERRKLRISTCGDDEPPSLEAGMGVNGQE